MPIMFRLLLISLCLTNTALADTWVVDDGGKFADFDNIQAAVDAASDGDTIYVFPGIYTSSDTSYPYSVVDISGKSILLVGVSGPSETIINGQGSNIGITCYGPDATITIEGFTIRNCSQDNHDGAGLYCVENSPTILNCSFINNSTNNNGGGMFFGPSCTPSIEDCTVTMNSAGNDGGGIFSESGGMTITNTTVCGNDPNQVVGAYTVGARNNICDTTDTWTVDDDGKADFDNIQAAVDASGDGDEIIVMPGTYTSLQEEVVLVGDRFLTIRSSDPSDPEIVATTIIDGEGVRRGISSVNTSVGFLDVPPVNTMLTIKSNSTAQIQPFEGRRRTRDRSGFPSSSLLAVDGFTIVNGLGLAGNPGVSTGGGIRSAYCNLAVSNCYLSGNSAVTGAGIYSEESYTLIQNVQFESNMSTNGCLAVYYGILDIYDSTFNLNQSFNQKAPYSNPAGLSFVLGQKLHVIGCTFTNNISSAGEAVQCTGFGCEELLVENCIFTNNSAGEDGGAGVAVISGSNGIVRDCEFIGNTAGMGGALWLQESSGDVDYILDITNCTFSQNAATSCGIFE